MNEIVLRRGETLEPPTVCQFRAGERVCWKAQGDPNGRECRGVIHEIRWARWTWMLGIWIDGDERQITEGKPRLHWAPIAAKNCLIERVGNFPRDKHERHQKRIQDRG